MHLNDIAIRVVEKNLLPARNGCLTPVRKGDVVFVKVCFERLKIVSSIGYVPPLKRINCVTGPKTNM